MIQVGTQGLNRLQMFLNVRLVYASGDWAWLLFSYDCMQGRVGETLLWFLFPRATDLTAAAALDVLGNLHLALTAHMSTQSPWPKSIPRLLCCW